MTLQAAEIFRNYLEIFQEFPEIFPDHLPLLKYFLKYFGNISKTSGNISGPSISTYLPFPHPRSPPGLLAFRLDAMEGVTSFVRDSKVDGAKLNAPRVVGRTDGQTDILIIALRYW